MKLTCPKCYEDFTLLKILKVSLRRMLPSWTDERVDVLIHARDLADLKRLYFQQTTWNLTHREHEVCIDLINGHSYEDIAQTMTVTRERVRQIFYKALRKLKNQENKA
jgi:DNA-directed RNA polymerase sigma subunit (sigma70/sigma32)